MATRSAPATAYAGATAGPPAAVAHSRLRRLRNPDLAAVAIPALLAAALCTFDLGVRSIWLDESATISIVSQHGVNLLKGIVHDGGNMLAYYVFMHFVVLVFGDGVSVMRVPSVIAAGLTSGLVAMLGLKLFSDRRLALFAGLLTAVSLPLIYWGQDARGYALMVTLVTASFYELASILQTPQGQTPRRLHVRLYWLYLLLGLYVGFDVALIIPAQLLLLCAFPHRARTVLKAIGAVALCCIPLVVLATVRGTGQLFWVPSLSLSSLGQAVITLLSAGMPPNFHEHLWSYLAEAFSGILMLVAAVAALLTIKRGGLRDNAGLFMVISWVLVPAAVALLAAAFGKPVELSRCAPMAMPGLALLFAWALLHPRVPIYVGVSGLLLLLGLRSAVLGRTYGISPENWKGATAYVINTNATQPACMIFYPQDTRMAFDYYLLRSETIAQDALTPIIPATPWTIVKPFVEQYNTRGTSEIGQIVQECPRLWIVASHPGSPGGPVAARADYRRYESLLALFGWDYPQQSEKTFGWASSVYIFELSRPV